MKYKKAKTKKDKILDVNKGDHVVDMQDTTFEVNPVFTTDKTNYEHIDPIDLNDISKIIEDILEESWENKYNDAGYNFKKIEINEIYRELRPLTRRYEIIDVLSVLGEYLNINLDRLYNFLGNAYKNEIIEYLDDKSNVLSKNKIVRLF